MGNVDPGAPARRGETRAAAPGDVPLAAVGDLQLAQVLLALLQQARLLHGQRHRLGDRHQQVHLVVAKLAVAPGADVQHANRPPAGGHWRAEERADPELGQVGAGQRGVLHIA